MNGQWHKIVALLMLKLKQKHIEISPSDIEQLVKHPSAVKIQTIGERIVLDLIPMAEAERLARKEGGLAH
jgi:hypothetical protein